MSHKHIANNKRSDTNDKHPQSTHPLAENHQHHNNQKANKQIWKDYIEYRYNELWIDHAIINNQTDNRIFPSHFEYALRFRALNFIITIFCGVSFFCIDIELGLIFSSYYFGALFFLVLIDLINIKYKINLYQNHFTAIAAQLLPHITATRIPMVMIVYVISKEHLLTTSYEMFCYACALLCVVHDLYQPLIYYRFQQQSTKET